MHSTLTKVLGLVSVLLSSMAMASETIRMGESLFQEGRCMACHTNRPFNGEHSRINSFKSLTTMVESCNTNLGLGWFPDEVEAVSHFLNHHHYKFPLPEQ